MIRKELVLKSVAALIVLVFTSFDSLAQSVDAKSIIEKTSEQYKQWGGVEADFDMNIRWEKNNASESFTGKIIIRNDKFCLQTPDAQTWFDGVTQWTLVRGNNEVNVSNPGGKELEQINPMLLFRNYAKDYNVEYVGESTSHNMKTSYDITLVPKKKDDTEKIEIQIEKTNFYPEKIVVHARQGIKTTITIKRLKQNKNLSDDMFVFSGKEHPDVEVVDLR